MSFFFLSYTQRYMRQFGRAEEFSFTVVYFDTRETAWVVCDLAILA